MPRYKLTLEYDGTPFVGWQLQENGPSVQGRLAQAIKAFSGEDTVPRGAGRTDAGVHALGQVAHFDLAKDWAADKVRDALNAQAAARSDQRACLRAAPRRFRCAFLGDRAALSLPHRHHARSPLALDRNRAWHVLHALDAAAMHEAAQALVGHHDFTTFRSAECQAASPVKTLDRLAVARAGDDIMIEASARSFLHNQVRSMVGSLKLVGEGRWAARRPQTGASRARSRRVRSGGARLRPLPCEGRLLNRPSPLRFAAGSG